MRSTFAGPLVVSESVTEITLAPLFAEQVDGDEKLRAAGAEYGGDMRAVSPGGPS